jgi:hypothetical protein
VDIVWVSEVVAAVVEKQIPCGNDSKKSKSKDNSGV